MAGLAEGYKRKPEGYDLERFVAAQQNTYAQATRELAAGHKRSHWMWFIFPQIHGLGASSMAQRYAISGLDEARAYLAHETLGPRLRACTELVNAVAGRTLEEILGYPDDLKFHSSVTLFDHIEPEGVFCQALDLWFGGRYDAATLARL